MKKRWVLITIIAYFVASLVGVTFAWMSSPTIPETKEGFFGWGDGTNRDLTVQEREISFKAYYIDREANTEIYLNNQIPEFDNIVPNEYKMIRLDFTNNSTTIADIVLNISDIEVDEDVKEYIYFGINLAEGYNPTFEYEDPTGTYVCLSDAVNNATLSPNRVKCTLTVLDDLQLTPTVGTDKISIYMYIMLNRNAPNGMQGRTIKFGTIRVILA